MPRKHKTIKGKLMGVILVTSSIVLLVASLGFIAYELITFMRTTTNNLGALGKVIATHSGAMLLFQGEEEAQETLSALRLQPEITEAALYDSDGQLFVFYPEDAAPEDFPIRPEAAGFKFETRQLILFEPVIEGGERVGTVYLKSEMRGMFERFGLYSVIVLLVLAGSFLVALVLSNALQRRISRPILSLVQTAKKVSGFRDYSVRAEKMSDDELGLLTDAFNHMLGQIQERDAAIREQQERLKLALEASQTGTWDWNLATNKLGSDEYLLRLAGVEPGSFGGTVEECIRLIHPDDRDRVKREMTECVQERKECCCDFRVVWPNGEVHYISSRGKAWYDETGRPLRMTGVALDVTESKRAEEEIHRFSAELEVRVMERTAELEATNRELEAFTYSVSHDLRAPLRHIDGFARLLQEGAAELTPDNRQYLDNIRHSTQNMARLVDDLLNLARIGRREIQRRPVPLNQLVDEVLAEMKPEIEHRQIEWRIGELGSADCDPGLIKQVFDNLLSNAVKYSRSREQARIEIDRIPQNGKPVYLVRDNGVGFNMKYVGKVFGVFQRLHPASDFEGTGVGLAIVERIIHKHGGQIWAEAKIDQGASFYFTLNWTPPPAQAPDRSAHEN